MKQAKCKQSMIERRLQVDPHGGLDRPFSQDGATAILLSSNAGV